MSDSTNYTVRLVALFAVVAVSAYSCSSYNSEQAKQDTEQMKICMAAGHVWKEARIRGWHYCE